MNTSLQLEKDGALHKVTRFPKEITKLLAESLCNYKQNTDDLIEKIRVMQIDSIDFQLSKNNIIHDFKLHSKDGNYIMEDALEN